MSQAFRRKAQSAFVSPVDWDWRFQKTAAGLQALVGLSVHADPTREKRVDRVIGGREGAPRGASGLAQNPQMRALLGVRV